MLAVREGFEVDKSFLMYYIGHQLCESSFIALFLLSWPGGPKSTSLSLLGKKNRESDNDHVIGLGIGT